MFKSMYEPNRMTLYKYKHEQNIYYLYDFFP